MNKNGLIYTVIFCFIITFFFVFFLALVNVGTLDLVEQNQEIAANQAVLNALNIAYDRPTGTTLAASSTPLKQGLRTVSPTM